MKRLLALSHSGVLDVNRALFQSLAKVADAEVTLLVPRAWRGDLIRDLRFKITPADDGLRVVPLPSVFAGNGSLFMYAASLGRIAAQLRPDYVFVDEEPWSLNTLQAFHALRDYPRAFTSKQNIRKTLPLPFRKAERWVFNQATLAFSVSDEVSDVLRWKGYSRPLAYFPFSYDPALFPALEPDARDRLREEHGIPKDALVFGYFGRLTEEKGIDELLEAMRRAQSAAAFENSFFFWVGNGPLADRVAAEVAALRPGRGKAIRAVPHDRVGATLALSDVLVLPSRTTPSWKEQFGRVLVEALSCGAAVAGSDSGEIPHIIRRSGGGVVFRERDPDDLFARLTELAAAPEKIQAFGAAGRRYVPGEYSHDAVARRLAVDLGFTVRA